MSVSESVDERPPAAADKKAVGTPARPWFRRRRALGGLAALLAAAVAIPVGVHVTGSGKAPSQPDKDVPVAANEARRTSQETGKEVEATAERSANTTTFARPDGTFRKQIYSSAVRAKVDGEWKPIDTTLQRVKDGYAAKAVNGRVVFSAGSQQGDKSERASRAVIRVSLGQDTPTEVWTDLVRLNTDGHDLAVSWPGTLPQPVIDGPRALYENVRPGIDLLMTAQDGGYSHLLVVKNKQAAADPLLGQLKYRLASPDLTFHLDTQSSAVSARDGEGEEIAGSPTPMMWDSSGQVTTTDNEPAWRPTDTAQQHPTLALPGLAGAEGARLKPATAALADNTLSVTPDASLLNAAETVYPVFIDPSFKGRKHAWSLLYKTEGNSSFYNGQNYNASGTNEARVGYESTTGGTSRSIFNFDFGSQLHGVGIDSAVVRALQTYSWSCSQKQMDIYSTPYVTSSSTWNNTTGWWTWKVATEMAGYGYNSSCPDNWIAPDIKGLVTHAANNGWGALSLGFAAPNESDSYYWKKFIANGETAPYIEVFYHTPPDVPLAMNMQTSPGGPCLTNGAGTAIGKTDVTFQVKGVDRDDLPQRQNLHQVQIEVWNATTGAPVYNKWLDVNSEGVVTATVPVTSFDDGQKYYWLARAKDIDGWWSPGSGPLDSGGGGWCTLTVSHTIPPNPVVDSAAFPPHGDNYTEWSVQPASTPGQKITFKGNGAKLEDIREYQWSLNRPLFDQKAAPNAAGEAEVSLQVDTAGPNVLYARTVSKSGNISNSTLYKFLVKPQAGQDKPGDVTGDGHPDLLAIDGEGNLLTYAGDQIGDTDYYMLSGVQNGLPATGYWKTQNEIPALIGHSTDWFPGDGLTDLIARMPDGKLYIYPGLGNRAGQFDVDHRIEILLPASAPSPATFRQIVVSEDVDGDGFADLFALDTAGGFWIFSGYTGGSFTSYKKLAGVVWTPRDLIGVRDVTGDKVPDLLFRDNANASRGILLRKGKPGANGGVDLQSIAASIDSDGGQDYTYATTGWGRTAFPKIMGTADATGDGIPDIWAVDAAGKQWLYQGRAGAIGPASGVDEDAWNTFLTIG
ncbi:MULTISPECIES: DNRLRE domain-containing protein [unclassified Streptomyces]|uniref:DNRLRE domain-containing protein n=1 Tax=unclassified Streptomyces TaxID=2593676 RepID=UPI000AECF621|nr:MULTISPECIES: DNRLRE domain-containing protein [unclassified Streptomyces]